jgi:cellobiose-specific phosphotransferase system component IIC
MDIDNGNKLIDTVTSTTDYVTSKGDELLGSISHKIGKSSKYVAERGSEIAEKTTKLVQSNMSKYLPSIVIGSLTLVAGLSWNSAFESLINSYVPQDTVKAYNAWFKMLYAFILTIIIVIAIAGITYYLPEQKKPN